MSLQLGIIPSHLYYLCGSLETSSLSCCEGSRLGLVLQKTQPQSVMNIWICLTTVWKNPTPYMFSLFDLPGIQLHWKSCIFRYLSKIISGNCISSLLPETDTTCLKQEPDPKHLENEMCLGDFEISHIMYGNLEGWTLCRGVHIVKKDLREIYSSVYISSVTNQRQNYWLDKTVILFLSVCIWAQRAVVLHAWLVVMQAGTFNWEVTCNLGSSTALRQKGFSFTSSNLRYPCLNMVSSPGLSTWKLQNNS